MAGQAAVAGSLRRPRTAVSLVDADPELARRLGASAAEARIDTVANVRTLKRGPWRPDVGSETVRGWLGLLVLDGFLLRDIAIAGRQCCEPLGPGDLIRPWDEDRSGAPMPAVSSWAASGPVRIALLDGDFARRVQPWPQVTDELLFRAIRRSRTAVAMLAISHLVRIEDRVLVALWHLADRWGRRLPGGVLIPMRLTHRTLGALIGARRPSVTTALGALTRGGALTRVADGWLLHGSPPVLDAGGLAAPSPA